VVRSQDEKGNVIYSRENRRVGENCLTLGGVRKEGSSSKKICIKEIGGVKTRSGARDEKRVHKEP